MKIKALRKNALNEQDRLDLARLLLKAGYIVKIGAEKNDNRAAEYYVEYNLPTEDKE